MTLPDELRPPPAPGQNEPAPLTSWPMHPLLIAAYPALALLAHNRHEAHVAWALLPLATSVLAGAVLWVVLALVMRNWRKSGLAASLAVLFFFSFGHLTSVLEDAMTARPGAYYAMVLFFEFGLVLLAIAMLHRATRGISALTIFANVAAAVLVFMPVLNLVRVEIAAWRVNVASISASAGAQSSGEGVVRAPDRPDVYLIVPDAHARGDVMHDLYQYDMEPFLEELESLGFVIARQSTSNYSLTPKSLASFLNYRYLEEYDDLPRDSFRPYAQLIRDAAFVHALKQAGYKTLAFPSGHSYSEMEHFDDYRKNPMAASMFHRLYAELTPLAPLLARSQRWNAYVTRGNQMLETLAAVPMVARDPAPTFTFVHISLPHPPFRFDDRGFDVFQRYYDLSDNGKGGRLPEDQPRYRQAYRGQAIYTDKLLLEAIRQILARSPQPPLILLMSDHGSRLNMDWDDPAETDVREAMGNLTAVYLPEGKGADAVYPTITPVNLMRVVLNEIFGANLPVLPDRAFLSVNHEGWYRLVEVTDRLHATTQTPAPDSAQMPAREKDLSSTD